MLRERFEFPDAGRAHRTQCGGRCEGMTMMELAVVLAVSAILATFVGPPLIEAVTAYDRINSGLDAQARLRYALERMVAEIRQMDMQSVQLYNHNTSPLFALTQNIAFTKHDGVLVTINGTGIPGSSSTITLNYSTGITGAQTLATGVTAFTISRYTNSILGTTAATTPANIAAVTFTMTITQDGIAYQGTARADLRSRW